MLKSYIKHVLESENRAVKSLRITRQIEYTATENTDTVFYDVTFDFIDVIEHKHCTMCIRVDFHDYETKRELYADYLTMTITY